ncbi:hypothetical protein XIS1_1350017 [Xenorhabdus innexi]|uniref:Uncharacterized protein n=1 Tax=Xenorhabdus innexi TaxID=290109 RepID=A0A1N6MTG2_9GAMM|nr:hypothetical protein XIS1_1350017 [Xenorhabdus innexi]
MAVETTLQRELIFPKQFFRIIYEALLFSDELFFPDKQIYLGAKYFLMRMFSIKTLSHLSLIMRNIEINILQEHFYLSSILIKYYLLYFIKHGINKSIEFN